LYVVAGIGRSPQRARALARRHRGVSDVAQRTKRRALDGARGRAPAVVTRSSVRSAPARELTKRPPGADEGRRNLLAAFYATLDGKPSPVPLPTFADGLRHVRFAEAAIVSARRRAWVDIADMKTTVAQAPS